MIPYNYCNCNCENPNIVYTHVCYCLVYYFRAIIVHCTDQHYECVWYTRILRLFGRRRASTTGNTAPVGSKNDERPTLDGRTIVQTYV